MQYSLRSLLIVVTALALLTFALSLPWQWGVLLLTLAAYGLWIFSVAAAISLQGERRCAWAGFAVVFLLHPVLDISGDRVGYLSYYLNELLPNGSKFPEFLDLYDKLIFQLLAASAAGALAAFLYRRNQRLMNSK